MKLLAPLSGWCLPLREVPDPVFSQGMAGDGVAIDPIHGTVLAPCDGEVVIAGGARHAITVRQGALEVMVHVGIDTVKLGGEGFDMQVRTGESVRAGQLLLRFDIDRLARKAPSLVTPVLVAAGGSIVSRLEGRRVAAGDVLMEIAMGAAGNGAHEPGLPSQRRAFRMPYEHGLHVRPAAEIANALRLLSCEVELRCRGRVANARSTVSMMMLGASRGESIEVVARGADADAALAALASLFEPVVPPAPAMPPAASRPARIVATVASRGMALGPAALWTQPEREVAETGAGAAAEGARLDRALRELDTHLQAALDGAGGEHRALLEGHRALVADPELRRAAQEAIARGKGAAFAWRVASREAAERLAGLEDRRMRERGDDLRDLEAQVLNLLAGEPPQSERRVPAGAIVLAEELLPSHVMMLERQQAAGVCLARGGATSHAAILAAAAGLPMLVAAGAAILSIPEGTFVSLDAEQGWLDVDPPGEQRATQQLAAAARLAERTADLAAAAAPAVTRDGVRIAVLANLGGASEVPAALGQGAEGSGLLRTEFLFLERRSAPSEDEQLAEYQRIAAALQGRPVSIRTMDVGGDKPLAYVPMPHEDNPALGLRGIRAGLRQPELLRTQLRAIARVEPAGVARVLLPMVTEPGELAQVRLWLEEAARSVGRPMPALGVMVETPASALLAASLAAAADFLSIGTNDLSQYTLAMDRGHPELARQLDALHPAVLRLIAMTAEGARLHVRSVSVCGALGGDLDAIPVLIGLGVRELSVSAASIPRVKRAIRGLNAADCASLARRALALDSAAAVRELVKEAS